MKYKYNLNEKKLSFLEIGLINHLEKITANSEELCILLTKIKYIGNKFKEKKGVQNAIRYIGQIRFPCIKVYRLCHEGLILTSLMSIDIEILKKNYNNSNNPNGIIWLKSIDKIRNAAEKKYQITKKKFAIFYSTDERTIVGAITNKIKSEKKSYHLYDLG